MIKIKDHKIEDQEDIIYIADGEIECLEKELKKIKLIKKSQTRKLKKTIKI